MRIISQDGKLDLPYEKLILRIIRGKYKDVMYVAIIEEGRNLTIAKYSSEEKAQKAMDMLHETYSNSLLIKTFDSLYLNIKDDKTSLEELRNITPWVVESYAPERKPMEIEMVPFFHFPQDDEVEV
jgi:hypothetical protein